MPASSATTGFNTKLQFESPAGSSTFVDIGEVYQIDPPELSREFVDVTNFESPNQARERKPALLSIGRSTFNVSMLPDSTTLAAVRTALTAATLHKFRLNPPDSITTKVYEWTAYVASVKDNVMLDDKNTTEIAVEGTGLPAGWIAP